MNEELSNKVMGISLLCDPQGYITDLLCDELGLANTIKVGHHFIEAFDRETQEKAKNFLAELKTKNLSFDWPLTMQMDDKRLLLLHFSGGVNNDTLFIVGTQTPASINQFFDELMKINNEQTNTLREVVKEQVKAQQKTFQNTSPNQQDSHLYEELSQVNNELANTQRELTKKNAQLEQQRKKLETLNTQLANTVDELQRTRHELLQSEKMASLGRLVSGFAHELNTPIGIAIGSASALQKEAKKVVWLLEQEEVDVDDLLSSISNIDQGFDLTLLNLERAGNLVNSFKRTAVDQTSGEKRFFNVKEVLQDIIHTLSNRFKNTRIDIVLECPADLKIVSLPGALEQIVTNLLINSLIHGFDEGKKAGKILIQAQLVENQLHLTYQDNGNGIPTDHIGKIFEPFFTTHRAHGGSGLGGYICYNLVTTQLKGSISCNSEEGQGVNFNIQYPIEFSL